MLSPSDGPDIRILLIGEILYATDAWDSLSALGKLQVRGLGNMKIAFGVNASPLRLRAPTRSKSVLELHTLTRKIITTAT